MMKLLFSLLFFSCTMHPMLIPIFNDDFFVPPSIPAPPVPQSPSSLLTLTSKYIAHDKLLFPAALINSLPPELAEPIFKARSLIRS